MLHAPDVIKLTTREGPRPGTGVESTYNSSTMMMALWDTSRQTTWSNCGSSKTGQREKGTK